MNGWGVVILILFGATIGVALTAAANLPWGFIFTASVAFIAGRLTA